MSNGDPINAGEKSFETQTTALFPQQGWSPGGPLCYIGVSIDEGLVSVDDAPGLIARGNSTGTGVIGWGGVNQGAGVVGWGGASFSSDDNRKTWIVTQQGGDGVVGAGGKGRAGFTDPLVGQFDPIPAGDGVVAFGGAGDATPHDQNATNPQPVIGGVGVFGQGGAPGGTELPGSGIVGITGTAYTLSPFPIWQGCGVVGAGPTGVYGFSDKSIAVRGTVKGGLYAGVFDGPVHVTGNFTVTGAKMVVAPFPDGSHRGLYCMESPECWFEDFGEGKLVKGQAKIRLPKDFAATIKTDSYHVFVTPYGNSNGLYVSKQNRQGFVVVEQGNGKSNVRFSFRVVGKRRGIKAERFAKVSLPEQPPIIPKSSRKRAKALPKKPAVTPATLLAVSLKTIAR